MSEVGAVVGLGYVGLPLPVEFGKEFDTIGSEHHYDVRLAPRDELPSEPDAVVAETRHRIWKQ